jgi:CO/xanthine dehydrogenase FAD-binding subunit
MKPAPFAYQRPAEVAEALASLAEFGAEAAVLAGGQSLVPLLATRRRRPALLVDINGLSGLGAIDVGRDGVRVGATVRQRALERDRACAARVPLLAQALPLVGRVGTRNRGTVSGSIAFADPAAELPSVLVAGGGDVTIRSGAGSRVVGADEFYTGGGRTALAADELIVGVRFGAPAVDEAAHCWLEFGRRPGDLPLVGVAVSLAVDERGRVRSLVAVFAGVHDRPWALPAELSAGLVGQEPTAAAIEHLAHAASSSGAPVTDGRTTEEHRRLLVGTLLRRALHRCAGTKDHADAA